MTSRAIDVTLSARTETGPWPRRATDPSARTSPVALCAADAFAAGRFGQAVAILQSGLAVDASDTDARRQLAQISRVIGAFEEARAAYTALLSSGAYSVTDVAERALVLLRLKRFDEAEADLAALPSERTTPWTRYLIGVAAGLRGDHRRFLMCARRALAAAPRGAAVDDADRSQQALYRLALDDGIGAQRVYDALIARGRFDRIRYWCIPDLDDLAHVLGARADIVLTRTRLFAAAFSPEQPTTRE